MDSVSSLIHKICPNCNEEFSFESGKSGPERKYCSEKCNVRYNHRIKDYNGRNKIEVKIFCGPALYLDGKINKWFKEKRLKQKDIIEIKQSITNQITVISVFYYLRRVVENNE